MKGIAVPLHRDTRVSAHFKYVDLMKFSCGIGDCMTYRVVTCVQSEQGVHKDQTDFLACVSLANFLTCLCGRQEEGQGGWYSNSFYNEDCDTTT